MYIDERADAMSYNIASKEILADLKSLDPDVIRIKSF